MARDLLLVFALILLNAAFAGSELALVSLREGQLQRIEQKGERGRRVAALARDPNRFLATVQIGITLAGFLASATAAVSLAQPLIEPLDFLGGAAEPVAIVIVTIVLAFFTLVLGELAPKRIALQRAERWAMVASPPIGLLARIMRPAVWLLAKSTDVVVRLLGSDPNRQREDVTEEELRDLLAVHRTFTPEQREIIAGAFDIAERRLRDIVVPRGDVVSISDQTRVAEALAILSASGYTRAPLVTRDLDDVKGIVHVLDLVAADPEATVDGLARPVLALPETLSVLEALRQLQVGRESMAIVTNEYGGTEWIITVEDLLEELVGEIWDETDRDVRAVQRLGDGSFQLVGRFPIHDLVDLGIDLPQGEYTTIAGLVLDRLGHIPAVGEAITVNGWTIEVLARTDRAITAVRIRPAEE